MKITIAVYYETNLGTSHTEVLKYQFCALKHKKATRVWHSIPKMHYPANPERRKAFIKYRMNFFIIHEKIGSLLFHYTVYDEKVFL
jgi:hypothetical protein